MSFLCKTIKFLWQIYDKWCQSDIILTSKWFRVLLDMIFQKTVELLSCANVHIFSICEPITPTTMKSKFVLIFFKFLQKWKKVYNSYSIFYTTPFVTFSRFFFIVVPDMATLILNKKLFALGMCDSESIFKKSIFPVRKIDFLYRFCNVRFLRESIFLG